MRVVRLSYDCVIVSMPAEPEAEVGGVTMVGVDPEDNIAQGWESRYTLGRLLLAITNFSVFSE